MTTPTTANPQTCPHEWIETRFGERCRICDEPAEPHYDHMSTRLKEPNPPSDAAVPREVFEHKTLGGFYHAHAGEPEKYNAFIERSAYDTLAKELERARAEQEGRFRRAVGDVADHNDRLTRENAELKAERDEYKALLESIVEGRT